MNSDSGVQPRRIILSRKGFDSSWGGRPSPIMPNGELLSLPIPESPQYHWKLRDRYAHIRYGSHRLDKVLRKIGAPSFEYAHVDPDLRPEAKPRDPDWRRAFGQSDRAQGHLRNEIVGVGDLFLFYGWFRRVRQERKRWKYFGHHLHVIFGWLHIGRLVMVGTDLIPDFLDDHPHGMLPSYTQPDALYIASEGFRIEGRAMAGAGVFPTHQTILELTATGRSRSIWRLPSGFVDLSSLDERGCARLRLSYHRHRYAETPVVNGGSERVGTSD